MTRGITICELLVSFVLIGPGCSHIAETCEESGDCGDDLICHRAALADGGLAATGVCGYSRLRRGDVCAVTAECDSGLFCSNDLPRAVKQRFGTCVEVLPEGEACFRDANCAPGLVCEKPADAETGTCQVLLPLDAGTVVPVRLQGARSRLQAEGPPIEIPDGIPESHFWWWLPRDPSLGDDDA